MTPEEAREAREEVVSLLRELRPEAIALVDSWDWSDAALQSVLGRRDGNVRPLSYTPYVYTGMCVDGVSVRGVGEM